jgi:hypothetical protein
MISISVPLVPYGHTGVMNNAHISVGMGYGKTSESVIKKGEGYRTRFVPDGTVIFDEYTPLMLRGRFSGSLIDLDSVTQGAGGVVNIPQSDTVEGQFTIPAPWKGDPDYRDESEASLDSAMLDGIRQDIFSTAMMMPEELRYQGFIVKGGDAFCSMGFSQIQLETMKLAEACERVLAGGGTATPATCACSCGHMKEEQGIPQCQAQCETAWSQCPVASAPTAATDQELEQMRSVFRGYGYSEELVEQYVEMLRIAPPEAREVLMEQYKSK